MRTLTAFAAVVLAIAVFATRAMVVQQLGAGSGVSSVYGTRFGMSKEQTQLNFRHASLGRWRTANAEQYELLYWRRERGGPGGPSAATFVFHAGLLTAVRLHLDEDAAGIQTAVLGSTESVALSTKGDSAGVILTYTLRLCDINDGSPSAARQRWSEIESLLQTDPKQIDVLLRGGRPLLRAFD